MCFTIDPIFHFHVVFKNSLPNNRLMLAWDWHPRLGNPGYTTGGLHYQHRHLLSFYTFVYRIEIGKTRWPSSWNGDQFNCIQNYHRVSRGCGALGP